MAGFITGLNIFQENQKCVDDWMPEYNQSKFI